MERRFQTGTVVSAIGHAGLILWVLVGDWLFAAERPPETITMTVSTMTSDQFAELQATTERPAEEPAPVRPAARPDPVVEPQPEEPPPEEVVVPEAPPAEPVVEPPPEDPPPDPVIEPPPSDVPQAETEQALESQSTEIQPTPEAEEIIAPDPVTPETEAPTSDTPTPAVSDQPTDAPVVEDQPTEETVVEDTGDVTRTEANQDAQAETGMQTSIRPRTRPERAPEPEVAADQPAEDTPAESAQLNVQPVDDAATDAAIDALLEDAATDAPPDETAVADTGGQDLPQGPPLTGGEMGNISSAIARKWNLGAASTDAMSSTVTVRVSFAADGTPIDFELIESDGPSQTGIDKLFDTAQRAVNRAHQDGGLPLPPDKYDTWQVLDLVFDANGMRAR